MHPQKPSDLLIYMHVETRTIQNYNHYSLLVRLHISDATNIDDVPGALVQELLRKLSSSKDTTVLALLCGNIRPMVDPVKITDWKVFTPSDISWLHQDTVLEKKLREQMETLLTDTTAIKKIAAILSL